MSAAVACVLAIGYSLSVGGGAPRGAAAAVAPSMVRQLHPNVSIWIGDNYLPVDDQPAACPASIVVEEPLLVTPTFVEVALSVGGSKCDGEPLLGLHHEGIPQLVDELGPAFQILVDALLMIDPNLAGVLVASSRACGAVALAADTVIFFLDEPTTELVEVLLILPNKTVCQMALSVDPTAATNAVDG